MDLEGSGSGLIEVLYRHLTEMTEGNHKNHLSRYSNRAPHEYKSRTCHCSTK
jgi:hypothetical protein